MGRVPWAGSGVRLIPAVDEQPYLFYRNSTMNRRVTPSELCCPPAKADVDLRPVEGADADEELARLAKAIAHPVRIQILRRLSREQACVCGDLVGKLPLAQSTVSQHLKVLKDAGMIRGEVDGARICYCLEPAALRRVKALVGAL